MSRNSLIQRGKILVHVFGAGLLRRIVTGRDAFESEVILTPLARLVRLLEGDLLRREKLLLLFCPCVHGSWLVSGGAPPLAKALARGPVCIH